MIYVIACATFLSTMLGGAFALRLKDKLHLILGFSAGAVVGVAFFDLMPEALVLATRLYDVATILSVTALGFLLYLLLDRTLLIHREAPHAEGGGDSQGQTPMQRGSADSARATAGAGTLSAHSFLDGLGIGLAFKVSAAVGVVVALAVLAHDFSDGINTVNFVVKNGGERRSAFRWLLVDALAPVFGVLITLLFSVSEQSLGLLLALFAGFFLYIGASDLVPESHHAHPTYWTTLSTVLGAGVLYVVVHLAL